MIRQLSVPLTFFNLTQKKFEMARLDSIGVDNFCRGVFDRVKEFTFLDDVGIAANIAAIRHVVSRGVDGDVIEVGVWRGGSVLSMILTLIECGDLSRRVRLYDTFDGMTPSSDVDIDFRGEKASDLISRDPFWMCRASLDDVKNTVLDSGYPNNLIDFHVGDIRRTGFSPEKISILRLDTDWYDSTKHELSLFYERVSSGGVVIIDDYGHWMGCRKAVDEFISIHPEVELVEIDYARRYFIKP
jgi:hypothetical protein